MGFSRQEYWSGLPLPSPATTWNHLYICGMWELPLLSKTHWQWGSYDRGPLERHRKENELSGLGDERGARDYVCSLIASCIGMFSHSRHHDTVDRMDAGFMQTVFTSDSLTSCLYCLFSLNLGFLNAKWIFLKDETLIIMKLSSFPWLYSL